MLIECRTVTPCTSLSSTTPTEKESKIMSPELKQKAMLVKLTITQFSVTKQDKTATNAVKDQFQTGNDAGKYNKALFAKDTLKEITTATGAARTYFYQQTLPWRDEGHRIGTSANYLKLSEGMRKHKADVFAAVNRVAAKYDDHVNEARTRLGQLFNPSDYPTVDEFKAAYTFETEVSPLPQAADFRVDLNSAEVEHIRKEIEARNTQAQQAATLDLWKRLNTAVNAMSERLNDPKAIFRDTLVDNITEITEIIPNLNLTDDAALDRMAKDAKAKLTGKTPKQLRENINDRKETAKAADDLLATMAAYMGA